MKPRAAIVLIAIVALPVRSQVPVLRLTTPTASHPEPFTSISDVVDLDDGRLLLTDDKEHRLVLVDLATRSTRAIGRLGSGPAEFRAIGPLVARPGGAWLVDFAARRLLPIRTDGSFENTISFPSSIMARGTDASGVLYGETFLPRQSTGMADSMWILRWDPATTRIDTLLKYNAYVSASVGGGKQTMKLFEPIDTWTPLPNGELLLLEAKAYRAIAYQNAKPVRSSNIAWTPIRVTEAERDAWRKEREANPPRMMGQRGVAPTGVPEITFEFPATLPPFGGEGLGGRYTRVSPAGHVWVERMRAAMDSVPRYDVIDSRSGRLIAQVLLPPRSKLVGIGKGTIYVAARDADDVQFLRRFSDPVPPA